ncbi:MAG TPA: exodeoxyribonuclease VII small subunit [Candidatus Izemoplasmatales bacterium]|nr:exodeoxyribonuclease VII small subunit [Bacillota bacterium]HRY78326.1 exodeoxyribonuclease VII small subunit [Candidatus Izemoplasmatales bacterium]
MENNLTFEEALKTLELTVKELESGTLSLEDSVTKYNEGIRLAKYCHDLLKKAENVVVKLVEDEGLSDFPKTEE